MRFPPGSRYPLDVPVIAFRSKELPADDLSDLTKQAVGKASAWVGSPMLYDLVHFATDVAQDLILKYAEPVRESSTSIPEITGQDVGAVQLSLEEISGAEESPRPHNPSNKSVGNGDRVYIPPALRNLSSSSTPLQSKDQQEVGAGGVKHRVHDSPKDSSKVRSSLVVGVDEGKESARLKTEWEQLRKSGRHADMWAVRSKLPAFQERDSLLSILNSHRVTIVAGQTGCGKSTQVLHASLSSLVPYFSISAECGKAYKGT